ncbi:MAG TPA: tetratricopeptide repeat protein [Tepidisphaeraceae bacterium]|nr:tetratricopeptide repeat protein [Tepidisphaeraceae bacterium]
MSLANNQPGEAIQRGNSLIKEGKFEEAIALLSPVAFAQPKSMEVHGALGNAYAMSGNWPQAIAAFRRTVELAPRFATAHYALGSALAHHGDVNEALLYFRNADRLGFPNIHCDLGVALAKLGDYRAAGVELRKAIEAKSDNATAHFNLALILLLEGNFKEGLDEYEWRIVCDDFKGKIRKVDRPAWRGEDLRGKSILVHDEQGFGDAILFARYLPLLAATGARVILLCQKPLAALMRGIVGVQHIFSDGDPCPNVDFQIPIGSLPRAFGTTVATIPGPAPYLHADPARIAAWAGRLRPRSDKLRVGLAWRGNAMPAAARSIDPQLLAPLLALPGVEFHSVQKDSDTPPPAGVLDHSGELSDFAETAALIANLDQVISIDTAVSHLSAALGRETWMMLYHAADWRWLRGRRDSPWFPTMRLYRQAQPGQWPPVIAAIAADLAASLAAMARMKAS